jgi:hypothetical protein
MLTRAERQAEQRVLAGARADLAALRRALVEARMAASAQPNHATAMAALRAAEANLKAAQMAAEAAQRRCLDDGLAGLSLDLLSRRLPVGLLPLRLETRFTPDRTRLLIRAWPDDIHIRTHDPALSPREAKAAKSYFEQLSHVQDQRDHRALWNGLVSDVGLRRALYIATDGRALQAGRRPSGWSTPATLGCMPDRLTAHLWFRNPDALVQTAPDRVVIAPHPVSEALVVGPVPQAADGTPLGAEAAWMHDFKAAIAAGMALEVDLQQAPPDRRVHRLIVVGMRTTVPAEDQAQELAALLAAQNVSVGIDILSAGAATNLLPGATPDFGVTDPERLFDDEVAGNLQPYVRRRPRHLDPGGERSQGLRLARALGLPAEATGRAPGSGQRPNPAFQPIRRLLGLLAEPVAQAALVPGLAGEEVSRITNLFGAEDIEDPFEPLPHLLVGAQPYGILPLALPEALPLRPHAALTDGLRRTVFAEALARIPRVTDVDASTARSTLLTVLRSDAVSRVLYFRPILKGGLAQEARAIAQSRGLPDFDPADAASGLAEALGARPSDLAAMDWVLLDPSILGQLPLVRAARPDAPAPAQYLDWVGGGIEPRDLLAQSYPDGADPGALLFHLCRELVLTSLVADILDSIANDATFAQLFREAARDAPAEFAPGGRYWADMQTFIAAAMQATPRGTGWVWDPDPAYKRTVDAFVAVRALIGQTDADLADGLFRGLDLLSHRLDGWITRDAAERLAEVRRDPAAGVWQPEAYTAGLNLGAFGVVENLAPRTTPASAGYLLSPSPQQAVAGAVLLSADVADWRQSRGSDFAVDLASGQVQRALWLAEGLRQGQPLGALLGYQIERNLTEAGVGALVLPLRAFAPLTPPRLTPAPLGDMPASADAVADGLALLQRATPQGSLTPDAARLGLTLGPTELTALGAALAKAANAVDALSDLLLAEGVYQMVRGNPVRARVATDAMAGAGGLPDRFEVAETPAMGTAVTHRMALFIDAPEPKDWPLTPRAKADPEANAWAARWLPDQAQIHLPILRGGAEETATLAELQKAAEDRGEAWLMLAPLDLAVLAETPVPPPSSPLFQRLAALAGTSLATDAADRPAKGIGLAELSGLAHQISRCLLGFRPLAASELPLPAKPAEDQSEARIGAAEAGLYALDKTASQATDETAAEACLAAAAQYGLTPPPEGPMADRVARLRAEIASRLAPLPVNATFRERLRQLLGPRQPAIPPLLAPKSDLLKRALHVDSSAVRHLTQQAARVRGPVQTLWQAFRCLQLSAAAPVPFVLPEDGAPAAPWIGLPQRPEHGRTETIFWATDDRPDGPELTAALFIDAWTEVIPDPQGTGALAFHYDAPSTAAPNVILLGCPAPAQEGWSLETIVALVEEALNLGKMRMIDPELLGAAGQFLPALALRDGQTESSALTRMVLGGSG